MTHCFYLAARCGGPFVAGEVAHSWITPTMKLGSLFGSSFADYIRIQRLYRAASCPIIYSVQQVDKNQRRLFKRRCLRFLRRQPDELCQYCLSTCTRATLRAASRSALLASPFVLIFSVSIVQEHGCASHAALRGVQA